MSSSKPHYFVIGLFVLAAAALGIGGIIAVSSDMLRSPEYFIETYVDESVQGIDVGTPFKFRGVKVGAVSDITMVSEIYETEKMYVLIRVALEERVVKEEDAAFAERLQKLIEQGLRLKLVPQGITGLSFLEADLYPESAAPPLEIDWKPKYAYIPSTPAMMTVLTRSLSRLSVQLDSLDLKTINDNVVDVTSNLNVAVSHLKYLMNNAATASDEVIENIRVASGDLPGITSNLTETVNALEAIIDDSDRDIEQILVNLKYVTEDTRELIRMLKRNPGMLLAEPPERNLSGGGQKR